MLGALTSLLQVQLQSFPLRQGDIMLNVTFENIELSVFKNTTISDIRKLRLHSEAEPAETREGEAELEAGMI